MKIETRKSGKIFILDIKGKILLGEGTIMLRHSVEDAIKAGEKNIAVNLAEVSYIDASGIGELVGVHTSVSKIKGNLLLLNPTGGIMDILRMTKLAAYFRIFYSETEMIKIVGKPFVRFG